jgi:hypothetical protein
MKVRVAGITVGSLLAVAGAQALASGSSPVPPGPSPSITGGFPGSGFMPGPSTIHFSSRRGFVVATATLPPGATFGWHYHRTPILVVVTDGTLTLYEASASKCIVSRMSAGTASAAAGESAHFLHLARNEGATPVSLVATYIGVPRSLMAHPDRLDVYNRIRPSQCPASLK